jgi:predicted transcriptional regulator
VGEERKVVAITIRFKPDLVEQLKALAQEENRSFNGTVLEAVERYLRARRGRQPKDAPDAR